MEGSFGRKVWKEGLEGRFVAVAQNIDVRAHKYIAAQVSAVLISVIETWIVNEFEEPVEFMAELPYRIMLACTGEIGIGQIKKHEIETWMPSRNAYCETHSCLSPYPPLPRPCPSLPQARQLILKLKAKNINAINMLTIYSIYYTMHMKGVIEMAQINIRIDDDLKSRADALFSELGLNMTTAFNMFIRQAVRQGGIPFEITTKTGPFYSETKMCNDSLRSGNCPESRSVP